MSGPSNSAINITSSPQSYCGKLVGLIVKIFTQPESISMQANNLGYVRVCTFVPAWIIPHLVGDFAYCACKTARVLVRRLRVYL